MRRLLPIVFAGLAKRQGSYDNRAPQAWLAQLAGPKLVPRLPRKTAMRPFHLCRRGDFRGGAGAGEGQRINAYLRLSRLSLAYGWAYLTDRDKLRSLLWVLALACTLRIFWLAATLSKGTTMSSENPGLWARINGGSRGPTPHPSERGFYAAAYAGGAGAIQGDGVPPVRRAARSW